MTHRMQRGVLIGLALFLTSIAVVLILYALDEQITFYKTPKEIYIEHIGKRIRIGGLVKQKSIQYRGADILFTIIDSEKQMRITYRGILPALFREEQGVIAEGLLISLQELRADKIFAKHDENYRPPSLKEIQYDR